MSKAVLFFADGTEECEALIVVDLLRRAKVEVTTASVNGTRTITSSHGVTLQTDARAEEVELDAMDAVILPGGMPGTLRLGESKTVRTAAAAFLRSGKLVAAICAAPGILGELGLLQGRRATGNVHHRDKLLGAAVLDEEVVEDGNLITSYGLGGAIPFALTLVRRLAGEAEEARIRGAIEYRH